MQFTQRIVSLLYYCDITTQNSMRIVRPARTAQFTEVSFCKPTQLHIPALFVSHTHTLAIPAKTAQTSDKQPPGKPKKSPLYQYIFRRDTARRQVLEQPIPTSAETRARFPAPPLRSRIAAVPDSEWKRRLLAPSSSSSSSSSAEAAAAARKSTSMPALVIPPEPMLAHSVVATVRPLGLAALIGAAYGAVRGTVFMWLAPSNGEVPFSAHALAFTSFCLTLVI